jgi:hypothetical protein
MTRVSKISLLWIVALIGASIAWYKFHYPTYLHRYRLTIEIEIDGTVHTGSSVIEVRWIAQPKIGDSPPYISSVRGQGTFVDLGSRGALVAALHPDDVFQHLPAADILAMKAFGLTGGLESYKLITQRTGRRDLAPNNRPLLIWFSDVSDRKTARPSTFGHIPDLFGPTARLVAAYVEITRDSVVVDIDRKLPWYPRWAAEQRSGPITGMPGQFQLIYNMFVGDDLR